MNREQFLQMKQDLFTCAGADKDVEERLAKWCDKYIKEFGVANFIPRGAISEDTKYIRENMYRKISESLCNAEAGIESLEDNGMGEMERKVRLFVLTINYGTHS